MPCSSPSPRCGRCARWGSGTASFSTQLRRRVAKTGAACANSGKTTRRTGRNGARPDQRESIIDSMRSVFALHLPRGRSGSAGRSGSCGRVADVGPISVTLAPFIAAAWSRARGGAAVRCRLAPDAVQLEEDAAGAPPAWPSCGAGFYGYYQLVGAGVLRYNRYDRRERDAGLVGDMTPRPRAAAYTAGGECSLSELWRPALWCSSSAAATLTARPKEDRRSSSNLRPVQGPRGVPDHSSTISGGSAPGRRVADGLEPHRQDGLHPARRPTRSGRRWRACWSTG